MNGSETAPGLFSFTRSTALFFSVWVSLSSGSNYVCQSFLPCFVLLISPFLYMQVVGGEFFEPTKLAGNQGTEHLAFPIRTRTPLLQRDLLTCDPTSSRSHGSGLCLLVCNRTYFTCSTRAFSSIPSAIGRASSSLTYQTKRVRRCWKQYAISLLLLRTL